MRIIINQKGKTLHKEITDDFIRGRLKNIISFREIPVSIIYPISKYAPIGQYDIFTITLEVSHEGIKTPFMIGPKTFTAPFAAPMIDDFIEYLYAIVDAVEDTERWKSYSEYNIDSEHVLERGFTLDYIEGILPPTIFKYNEKFFEGFLEMHNNMMFFSSIVSSKNELFEEYYELLSERVISLETDVFINKEKPAIDADVIYDFPRFTVPISVGGWAVYITLGYEEYGKKIRQMFRISPLVYAPIDFEIMLRDIEKVQNDLKSAESIIEKAPSFYDPIKDSAKELIKEFLDYYKQLSSIAKSSEDLEIFRMDRILSSPGGKYLQVTPDGYELVIDCGNECSKKHVEELEEFEELINNVVTKAILYTL